MFLNRSWQSWVMVLLGDALLVTVTTDAGLLFLGGFALAMMIPRDLTFRDPKPIQEDESDESADA